MRENLHVPVLILVLVEDGLGGVAPASKSECRYES